MRTVYDFTVKDRKGKDVSLKEYANEVLLIVNTATKCGFTPQYDELEKLYKDYHSQGFEILDFPCNQFGQQAPGTDESIHEFCKMNFGTDFPRFKKVKVNGEDAEPLFKFLQEQKGFAGWDPDHNLTAILEDMLSKADPDYKQKADIRDGSITRVDFSQRPYKLWDEDGTELEADTVIIATGASAKYLGLDDERKYNGQGVSACATCDGFFYRKKTVAVVGGGDTACEDALYLAGLCKKVYMIVRKPFLRASKVMQQRVMERENIEILFEHNTLGLFGENGVEGAHLVKRKGEADETLVDIQIDGFFLAIGHKPNTDIFREWLDTDEVGYLKKIEGSPRTKLPGIFVAGDCADPTYRQAISAAGTGCQAAIEAERFLLNQ